MCQFARAKNVNPHFYPFTALFIMTVLGTMQTLLCDWNTVRERFKKHYPVICSFLILLIILCVTLGLLCGKDGADSVCLSKECVDTASRIINAMDRSANPCEDFYQYSCGNWILEHPIPKQLSRYDRNVDLTEKVFKELRKILEEEKWDGIQIPESVKKAKVLYQACLDTDALDKIGLSPIYKALKLAGLPKIPPDNQTTVNFDWMRTIVEAKRKIGLNLLVNTFISEDFRNSSVNKITISQISPGFKDIYLRNPKNFSHEIRIYKDYMKNMLKEYDKSFPNVENFTENVFNVMTQLAQVMTNAKIRRAPSHLFYDIGLSDLSAGPKGSTTWKTFDWERYFSMLFNETNVKLKKDDTVIITDLEYLKKLSYLLKTTEQVLIEKFLWWRVFLATSPLTTTRFRTLEFKLSHELFGIAEPESRIKKCTLIANNNFGYALTHMYMLSRYNMTERNKAVDMLRHIQKALQEDVEKSDWMDNATREKTITKIRAMISFVGFPKWILNTTIIDKIYQNTTVYDGNLVNTLLNITYKNVKENLESVRITTNRSTEMWPVLPTTVNAMNSQKRNLIVVPIGILQPPYFGNYVDSIDYGAIGAVMGHEIMHSFDDQGRRYDEYGNGKQWWSKVTLKKYLEKVRCIIDQYHQYYLPVEGVNYHVDGYLTQGENIADNGGVRAAFEGYRQHAKKSPIQNKLPGLMDLTPDQLFFLGYAQVWCGNATPKAVKDMILGETHSPNRIRVLGTLSNYEEFSKAWHCPADSPMNPVKKCSLW